MKLINIQTSDGEIVEVEWKAAQQSQIIRKMLDDLPIEEKSNPIKFIEAGMILLVFYALWLSLHSFLVTGL